MSPPRERATMDRAPDERDGTPPAPETGNPVLALQASAGNAATSRLLSRAMLYRQGEVCVLDEVEGRESPVTTAPKLTAEQARKVNYARTTLARVPPMTEADEKTLLELLPGVPIMDLISARNGSRSILRDKTGALERAERGEPSEEEEAAQASFGTASLEAEVAFWTDELARDQAQLDGALAGVGVRTEDEFKELVEAKFPDLFLRRANQVALTMLDENERLVQREGERMGVNLQFGEMYGMPSGPGEEGVVPGMRAAAAELAALQLDAMTQHITEGPPLDDATNAQVLEDEGYDWQTTEGDHLTPPRLPSNWEEIQRDTDERRAKVVARQNELGLKYPLLLRTKDFARIAAMSDDEINSFAAFQLVELKQNISDTRNNIQDGDLKVWHLRNVFEVTLQDLGITADSPLYAAVERRVDREERNERIWKIAMAAISLTAGLIGAFATAGSSLAVAGSSIAVLTGTYQLSQSVGEFFMETSASDVSLDPALADISTGAPDMLPIALDLLGLGLDSWDMVKAVKAISGPVRAARATGELEGLGKLLAEMPGVGDAGAKRILRTVTRDAAVREGVQKAIGRIGTSLHATDLKAVEQAIKNLGDEALQKGFDDLMTAGRIRPLNEDSLAEVYTIDEVEHLITNERMLNAGGFYDRGNGFLFVSGGTAEGLSGVVMHEITHYLQSILRPGMNKFMVEFEAYSVQRHYLQRLIADGIDPDVAFAEWKWLADATDDDIVRHLAEGYNLHPPIGADFQQAVLDAISDVGRLELPGARGPKLLAGAALLALSAWAAAKFYGVIWGEP
ncbi:MAG TPA: hypothetical protein PKD59_07570 [Miltoncostaeaceae bacterium]|nr:hypothetical protein [Miltoncostaeaceae bacterium]